MTPGLKTNIHYLPKSGIPELNISVGRANELMGEATPFYQVQLDRLSDIEGTFFPGRDDALIAHCAEDVLPEAYEKGFCQPTMASKKSNVVPFMPAFENGIQLNSVFGGVAQNDNGVSRAPKMHAMFDRAVKGFGLGAPTLDVPAFAA